MNFICIPYVEIHIKLYIKIMQITLCSGNFNFPAQFFHLLYQLDLFQMLLIIILLAFPLDHTIIYNK